MLEEMWMNFDLKLNSEVKLGSVDHKSITDDNDYYGVHDDGDINDSDDVNVNINDTVDNNNDNIYNNND